MDGTKPVPVTSVEAERAEAMKNAKRNEVAVKVAASSRKMPSDPDQPADKLVRVTANERPGFGGFSRAGQFWPSDPDGRLVYVTARMLAALKAETMLRVDESPDAGGVDLKAVKDQTSLDVPVRELVDEDALAIDAIARINREILALDARNKAAERQAVLDRMKRGEKPSQEEIEDRTTLPTTPAQVVAARDDKGSQKR